MRGARVKQLRRTATPGPGPDQAPGLGRAERRQTARQNRDGALRQACVCYLTGLKFGDKHLLDPQYDRFRILGRTRLLGNVHRLSSDRARRPERAA